MSRNMNLSSGRLALAILSLLLIATGSWANHTEETQKDAQIVPRQAARASFVLPPMINFDVFKHLFHRHYNSLAEEMSRKLNFMPRAFRAFTSAIGYKFGYSTSYKKVNEMSDYTRAEVEQIENVAGGSIGSQTGDDMRTTADEIDPGLRGHLESSGSPISGQEATDTVEHKPMEELNAGGSNLTRSARRKRDTTDSISWHRVWPLSATGRTDTKPNMRFYTDSQLDEEELAELDDEVYSDYRQTGCFATPRNQRKCGCCYAFSIISIMEYMLCMQNDKTLTLLSEQYIVDCGMGRYNNRLRGCESGAVSAVGNFVHDFGLFTKNNYRYVGRVEDCPYELDFDPSPAGEIRMDLTNGAHIHQDHWERILEEGGPLQVHAHTYRGLSEYGGGVDMVRRCSSKPNHDVVLVGHGREGGIHYWILRNSWGKTWGEEGYWRVAKSSACLGPWGEAFGTTDGINFNVQARLTNPPPQIFRQRGESSNG